MGDTEEPESSRRKSDKDAMLEWEERFKYLYTEEDSSYMELVNTPLSPPPCVYPWHSNSRRPFDRRDGGSRGGYGSGRGSWQANRGRGDQHWRGRDQHWEGGSRRWEGSRDRPHQDRSPYRDNREGFQRRDREPWRDK